MDVLRASRLWRRDIDALIVSRRPLAPITDIIEKKPGQHFVFGGPMVDGQGSPLVDKHHVELVTSVLSRRQKPPSEVREQAGKIEQNIKKHFDTALPIAARIEAKYRRHMASSRIWSKIIRMPSSLHRLVYVNDDTMKSLVWLCRQHGIDTTEVQHGYMGASHIGFSYPRLETSLDTMPHRTIITRDTGDITYPTPLVHVAPAPPRVDLMPLQHRDIDVLIGSSPRWRHRTQAIVEALGNSNLRVAIKLHPAQKSEDVTPTLHGVAHAPQVFDGHIDFLPLVRRCKVFLPANPGSTTSFEAVENGCALALYAPDGHSGTSVVDHLAWARPTDPSELVRQIQEILERIANGTEQKVMPRI